MDSKKVPYLVTWVIMNTKTISIQRDILGGTPVFKNTRVPVQTLIDYLRAGDTIDAFLADFPTVSREQVLEVLDAMRDQLLSNVA